MELVSVFFFVLFILVTRLEKFFMLNALGRWDFSHDSV